ncbi:MAG: RDD family protein [Actinobacteria bacterium]|nr:RDD family protein [Actinomycetota bacterium]
MAALYDRAGFGRRFLAITIDWAIASLTSALFAPPLSNELGPTALRLGIFVFEVSLLTALTGSSAGQRLFGLRVVSWPNQGYLPPSLVLLRTFLIALVIPAVVYDVEGRGLHDRLARSQVVRVGSGA